MINHFFNCYDLPNVILFYISLQFRLSSYATDKQLGVSTWGKRWKWSWKTSEKSLQNCIAKGLYSFPLSEQHDARFNSVRQNECFLGMCTVTEEAMETPLLCKSAERDWLEGKWLCTWMIWVSRHHFKPQKRNLRESQSSMSLQVLSHILYFI